MATYPQTKIEVIETYQPLHLSRGEADIALRIGKKPPDNLIARKLTGFSVAEYASKSYVENHDLDDPQSASRICSIDIDMGSPPAEFDKSRFEHLPIRGYFNTIGLQMKAAKLSESLSQKTAGRSFPMDAEASGYPSHIQTKGLFRVYCRIN